MTDETQEVQEPQVYVDPIDAAIAAEDEANNEPLEGKEETEQEETKAPDPEPEKAKYVEYLEAVERAEQRARMAERKAKDLESTVDPNIEQLKSLMKENPRQAIERVMQLTGMDYQTLTEQYINDGNPTNEHLIKQQQDRIQKLEQEQKQYEVQVKQQFAARNVQNYVKDVSVLLTDEKYASLHKYGKVFKVDMVDQATNLLGNHFQKYGKDNPSYKPLTPQQNLDMLKEWADKELEEARSQFQSTPQATPQRKASMTDTLTNRMSAESSDTSKDFDDLSFEEALKEAALQIPLLK